MRLSNDVRPSGTESTSRSLGVLFWAWMFFATAMEASGATSAAPQLLTQPKSRVVIAGTNHAFSVTALGDQPITYRWYFNQALLAAQTNSDLVLTNIQLNQAGSYWLTASNAGGVTTSAVATLVVKLPSDPKYAHPGGGWNYLFSGDAAAGNLANALDGTWNHLNNSSSWARDGRGPGMGMPGGLSTSNGVLTIEDAVSAQTTTLDNRRFYFTHNLNADPAVTNADQILNTGVTLSFRARLTPPSPVDPLTELTNAPNGWANALDGRGMFGIRQAGNNGLLVSFSLNRAVEETTTAGSYNFGQPGLHMNNLNGDVRTSFVDPGEAGTLNLLPIDPTVFHEFWITLQENGTAPGTHQVSIYVDGNYAPTVFNVTAGSGTEGPFTNYISLGLPVTAQTGAYDIDYFAYRQGVILPVGWNEPVGVVLQPVSQTLLEGQVASFTVGVTGTPPINYQWYKNGVPIPAATNSSYVTGPLLPSESGSQISVSVSNFHNVVTNSNPAVLTVITDNTPPALVSVGSLDGKTIGLCFSEPVSKTTAESLANYAINNGSVAVTNAILRAEDGNTTVALYVTGLSAAAGTAFTVSAAGIKDLSTAGNIGGGSASGFVQGLTAVDVGSPGMDPMVQGSTFVCDSTHYRAVAGGHGFGGTSDAFHFIYQARSGDFDVKVRVAELTGANPKTAAGLVAREGLVPGARGLNVTVHPKATNSLDGTGLGQNQYEASYRSTTDGETINWPGGGIMPGVEYPHGWIRLMRQGDTFSASFGTNGIDWTEFAQLTEVFAPTLLVGLGVTASTNSLAYPVTAQFSDFAFTAPPSILLQPASQVVTNGDPLVLNVVASGANDLRFQWRFNGVAVPGATGAAYHLAQATPSDQGNYDVLVSNSGGQTTSAVAAVLVRTLDLGDAPTPYPTLRGENGASHVVVSNIFLGSWLDYEPDGLPDLQAQGDNIQGLNDEDGVRFVGALVAGQTASVEVVASTHGQLSAWLDWNGNGSWADTEDQIFSNRPLLPGTNVLTFTAFPGATASNTFARFRFSTREILSFEGPAVDGEVEDYPLTVAHAADLAVSTTAAPQPVGAGSNLTYTITVQNLGPSRATSVELTNTLPLGVTLLTSTASQGACTVVGNLVTCALGTIPANGAANLTLVVQPHAVGNLTHFVAAGASELDQNGANNSQLTLVTVEAGPSITSHPVSLVVTQGNEAVFNISGSGTPPLSYQWQFNGVDVTGATSAQYAIASAQTNHEGAYRVKVSNRVGAVVSEVALLAVRVPPGILQQPQSRTNYVGGVAHLTVVATGTAPLSYQWFSTDRLPGETNSVLALTNAQKAHSGNYYVSVANVAGAITSSVARLTIVEADFGDAPTPGFPTTLTENGARHLLTPGVYLGSHIDFEPDGQPNSDANGDDQGGVADEDGILFSGPLHVGQATTLQVLASTNGFLNGWIDFNRSGSWEHPGEQIFLNRSVVAGTNQLTFVTPPEAVPGATFGRFRFSTAVNLAPTGEAPDGEVEDYQLTILPSADVAVSMTGPAAVVNGGNGALTILLTNQGPSAANSLILTQAWTGPAVLASTSSSQGSCSVLDEVVVCELGTLGSNGAAIVTLHFNVVETGTISNEATLAGAEHDPTPGNNHAILSVQVQEPPAIVAEPQSLTVTNGGTITLGVSAIGTSLSYQWQFGGTNLPGQTSSLLVVTNAQPSHAGPYRVIVSNGIGSVASAVAQVTVLVAPAITAQPVSKQVVLGRSVTFTVNATGSAPLLYEWWLNGSPIPGANQASLVLADAQPSAQGTYSVRVSNPAGSVTSTGALLTIILPPTILQAPGDLNLVAGNSASLSVLAGGTEPLHYQWFYNGTQALANETNRVLALVNSTRQMSGNYHVVVTNVGGAVTSSVAKVTIREMDFGDAQEATVLAFDGARHAVVPGMFLGAGVDFEPDGQTSADALGDDANGTDDEDGILFLSPLYVGQSALIQVVASTNGFLEGWIDFNHNGTWADGTEQVFAGRALQSGTNQLTLLLPASALPGQSAARFRFSSAGGLSYYGVADDGEVEDQVVTILPAVDLAVHISGQLSVASFGTNLDYSLNVRNLGPSAATGLVLSNLLPAGTLVLSNETSQGVCEWTNGMLICRLGNVEAGAEATVRVSVSPLQPGYFTNQVTVFPLETDVNLANNAAYASTTLIRQSRVYSNDHTIFGQDGGKATPYPATIEVSGMTATVFRVTTTLKQFSHPAPADIDLLLVGPQGQSVLLMSDAGGMESIGGVDLVFDDASSLVLPETSAFASETYRPTNHGSEADEFPAPAPGRPFGTNLNIFNGSNPNGTWSLYVVDDQTNELHGFIGSGWSLNFEAVDPFTDLILSQTDVPSAIPVGTNFTCSWSLTNAGPTAAEGVWLTHALPAGVTVLALNSSHGSCQVINGQVICWLDRLEAQTAVAVSLEMRASMVGFLTNRAMVISGTIDLVQTNNVAEAVTWVRPIADVSVSQVEASRSVAIGSNSSYTLLVSNAGPYVATGVQLSERLDPNMDFVQVASTQGVCAWMDGEVRCELGNINPGNLVQVVITAIPRVMSSVQNVASITANEFDFAPENNASRRERDVVFAPAPFVNTSPMVLPALGTASLYPSTIEVAGLTGAIYRVSVVLSNLNHSRPEDLDVLLVGPRGETVLLMSDAGGNNDVSGLTLTFRDDAAASVSASVLLASGEYRPTNDGLEPDSFAPPAPAGPYYTDLSVFRNRDANGTWSLYLLDDSGGAPGSLASGWSLEIETGLGIMDLGVLAQLSANPVGAGSNVTCTIVVTNAGPAPATGITLTNPIPLEVAVVSVQAQQGVCTQSNGIILCDLGNLAAGQSTTVAVRWVGSSTGLKTNSSGIQSRDYDWNVANNRLQTVLEVQEPPVLLASPQGVQVTNGTTVTLTAAAGGQEPLTLQWFKDGLSIPGATNHLLSIQAAQFADSGSYYLEVTNRVGRTVSDIATVKVLVRPTISEIPEQTINEDTATPDISFTISDADTPAEQLMVTVSSSNPGLIPEASILLGGSGNNRLLRLFPGTDRHGFSVITLSVRDSDGISSSKSFQVNVTAVNDLPELSSIPAQTMDEDSQRTIAFSVRDAETASEALIVTAQASQPNLLPMESLVLEGNGATRTLRLVPVTNQFGTTLVSLSVSDPEGGRLTNIFAVTVNPINDWPTIEPLVDLSIDEDSGMHTVNLSGLSVGALNEPQALSINVASSNPGLITAPQLFYTNSSNTAELRFSPATNVSGSAVITIQVDDGGASNNIVVRTFQITVRPVNDPPLISGLLQYLTGWQNEAVEPISIRVEDVETPASQLQVSGRSSNPFLVSDSNLIFEGVGNERILRLVPAANQWGTAVVTITVSDPAGGTNQTSFTLHIEKLPAVSLIRRLNASEVEIVFETATAKNYAVEYKNSLGEAEWRVLGMVSGNGEVRSVVDPAGTVSTRFYRVRVE